MTATAVLNGVMNGTGKAAAKPVDQAKEAKAQQAIQDVLNRVRARDPDQKEFLQACEEVLVTLEPVLTKYPQYIPVLERLCEPERQIMFRVPWMDDAGRTQVNRGYRVQFNSAIGPYKGGLRFHPSVTLSVIKFLGFEQTFKNALTTLPMGGGKGGSDFDPKGRSDTEVMRFCQSFMTELSRHIGPNRDVPAGDIGVGGREVGYLFGQYKRLVNDFTGTLTGKAMEWGGSNIRPEATGWGAVYFGIEILKSKGESIKGKRCLVSGSGNVATFAAEKLLELGAVVLTLSDSAGTWLEPNGFTPELLQQVMDLKNIQRGRLSEFSSPTGSYHAGVKPWALVEAADIALPCATQNEVLLEDAKELIARGVTIVLEGANMPTDNDAIDALHAAGVVLAAGKACNAGGVAVSGLEMAQNATMSVWTREEVDQRLQGIMKGIYAAASSAAKEFGVTLQAGANIAGFLKVARAMVDQGCV